MRPDSVYEFGPFRLEVREHRLIREGRPIPLTGKAFETLRVLVERHGTLVPKDELMQAVWPDTAVEENNLDRNISALRKALGEKGSTRRYIETVPRVGFRFIAKLADPSLEEATTPAALSPDISAIAVLPFVDMSPERDQDYLCEGLAEELINALTNIEGLRVASRTASFQFRERGADVRKIGQHLGAGVLLEGSVRKADDRLRVTVQLIETETGYHRWSQRFDRTLNDVFAIQDEIAETVATSLRGGDLTGPEKRAIARQHTAAVAYEFYLRGRQYLPRLNQPDLQRSAEMFEQAIALDANYAPALAGLAMVHATLFEWYGANQADLSHAEASSQRALELAPRLVDAHVSRGFTYSLSGCYKEAAWEFEQAIQINSNFFDAYYYYARSSFASGDTKRAAELFQLATNVRHEDFQSPILLAQCLRMLGRKKEAISANNEGIRRAEMYLALNPVDQRTLSLGSGALEEDGQIERALAWSRRSLELYPDDMGTLINAACLRAKLGQKQEALDLLERVFSKGRGKRDWIEHDPDYDCLRDDPRFQAMLAKLH